MVAEGDIQRLAPRDGRGFNQIALSQQGCDKYLGGGEALQVTWPQPRRWKAVREERAQKRAQERAARREYIIEGVSEGKSLSQIGRELGLAKQTMSHAWKRIAAELGE